MIILPDKYPLAESFTLNRRANRVREKRASREPIYHMVDKCLPMTLIEGIFPTKITEKSEFPSDCQYIDCIECGARVMHTHVVYSMHGTTKCTTGSGVRLG